MLMTTVVKTNKKSCSCLSCELRELVFSSLDDEDINIVCEAREERAYARGEIIHREGDLIHDFKYLKTGLVKLYKSTNEGEEQIITIFASTHGYTDTLKKEEVGRFKKFLLKYLHQKHPEIMRNFSKNPELTPELEKEFEALIKEFFEEVYLLQYHPEVYHAEKERREARAAIEATEKKAARAK